MMRMTKRSDELANVRVYNTITFKSVNRKCEVNYRKVRIFVMKFGISNKDDIN